GSASMIYHISVFPKELCLSLARRSSGCSCMERSCLASINLIKMGKSGPNRRMTSRPKRASASRAINFSSENPLSVPLATSEISPFTPESSQLSPVISLLIGFPRTSFSFVPPHRRSLRMGLNFNGYRSMLSCIGYKITGGLIKYHLQILGALNMGPELVPDHQGNILGRWVQILEFRYIQV